MLWPIVALIAGAITIGVYTLLLIVFRERFQLASRLRAVGGVSEEPVPVRQELTLPLWRRLAQPLVGRLTRKGGFLSRQKEKVLAEKLLLAGKPGNLSPAEFTLARYIAVIVTVLIGLLLTTLVAPEPINFVLAFAFALCLGILIPNSYLNIRAAKRQRQVLKKLPDTLDLLTVSIESGMGFDGAILKVTEKTNGPLAQELKDMLQEIHVGKSRREALRDLADRLKVDDLSSFVGAVIMAEQMGVRLGNVLRIQSDQMRRKRRQRAEEQALKAPIKMLFPLVFFIFPAIFVVLLGPAVIRIMEAL